MIQPLLTFITSRTTTTCRLVDTLAELSTGACGGCLRWSGGRADTFYVVRTAIALMVAAGYQGFGLLALMNRLMREGRSGSREVLMGLSWLVAIVRTGGWVASAVVLALIATYVAIHVVALFHANDRRRADARALLSRHRLARRVSVPPSTNPTADPVKRLQAATPGSSRQAKRKRLRRRSPRATRRVSDTPVPIRGDPPSASGNGAG